MKVVSAYRPFPVESAAHRKLGAFDWIGALARLRVSVRQSCDCETFAITDVDTDLQVPAYHYVTLERRLMLWILEVSRQYLASPDFDQDTIMLSPDLLVYHDLAPWFRGADLGLLVRLQPKFIERGRPIMNACQWWRHDARAQLVAFFEQALALAKTLPEPLLRWGADTEPLRLLMEPLQERRCLRAGLVVDPIPYGDVMETVTDRALAQLQAGGDPPRRPIADFKGIRKHLMADYFAVTFGREARCTP